MKKSLLMWGKNKKRKASDDTDEDDNKTTIKQLSLLLGSSGLNNSISINFNHIYLLLHKILTLIILLYFVLTILLDQSVNDIDIY
mgnify:CR=1 FL=1